MHLQREERAVQRSAVAPGHEHLLAGEDIAHVALVRRGLRARRRREDMREQKRRDDG
jgi:hypothetical protein